jgi:hypothetical protein
MYGTQIKIWGCYRPIVDNNVQKKNHLNQGLLGIHEIGQYLTLWHMIQDTCLGEAAQLRGDSLAGSQEKNNRD